MPSSPRLIFLGDGVQGIAFQDRVGYGTDGSGVMVIVGVV